MKSFIFMAIGLAILAGAQTLEYSQQYNGALELPIHDRAISMTDCHAYQKALHLSAAELVATISKQDFWTRQWRNYCVFRDAPAPRPRATMI